MGISDRVDSLAKIGSPNLSSHHVHHIVSNLFVVFKPQKPINQKEASIFLTFFQSPSTPGPPLHHRLAPSSPPSFTKTGVLAET